jgi:hypothetical protein
MSENIVPVLIDEDLNSVKDLLLELEGRYYSPDTKRIDTLEKIVNLLSNIVKTQNDEINMLRGVK